MQNIGCWPDLTIYNCLIRLGSKLGDIEEGVNLWNKMEACGLSPGLDTFVVIIIRGFITQGHMVEACDYFKEMVPRGLLSATNYGTLKDLPNSLLRAEKLDLAKDVWSCIIAHGYDLNVHVWTSWIHVFFSRRHMIDADLVPRPDTFAKLMRGLQKHYNRQIAAEITEKVRKMYKRHGERDIMNKKVKKTVKQGRKMKTQRCQLKAGGAKADIMSGLN